MSDDESDHEVGISRRKKHLLLESMASTSNDSTAYIGSRRKSEIEIIEERLRAVEEEAEMLKEALFESVEERTKLMSEINEHFSTLMLQKRESKLYGHEVHIISLLKNRRAGLLQILWQESSPSIVNKGLRSNSSLAKD